MATIDLLLLIGAALILVSILISKVFQNIGIPTMLLFITVGILAGSEGIGGIYFDDAQLAQSIGIIALVFILFSGGLDTNWSNSKDALYPAVALASIGVLFTAVIIGLFVMWLFDTSLLWGLLFGSIISSTDAATVFSILRGGNISLKGKVKPLLELESGSNDPMAVFLTIGTIELLLAPEKTVLTLIGMFLLQVGLGGFIGFGGGKLMGILLNKLKFPYEGVYPIFALAIALLIYSLAAVLGGSGFLAIYVAGVVLGNCHFIHKRSLIRFFDGLAVLSQITMFLTLGLLVFPSELLQYTGIGLLLSGVLIFIARPVSVLLTLLPFKFDLKEKVFASWVGLRGAVPIILATFALLMGIENSNVIFDLVFFIVITSVLIQGWSIKYFANFLNLATPVPRKSGVQLEFTSDTINDTDIIEIIVPHKSSAIGKQIVELNFHEESRIVLITRDEKNIVPSGGTVIKASDIISIIVNQKDTKSIREIFS